MPTDADADDLERARRALADLRLELARAAARLDAPPWDPDELSDLAIGLESAAATLRLHLAPDPGHALERAPCPRCTGWEGAPAYAAHEGEGCRRCGGEGELGYDALTLGERCAWTAALRAAAEAARAVEWGEVTDYYPEAEAAERAAAWEHDRAEWGELRDAAVAAAVDGDRRRAADLLERAADLEREWGDAPATREVRALLARRAELN